MAKLNVVLDTNIYRKNPSRSDLPFKALERLCKAGICRLHLPYIVEREFQTQQVAQYQKELAASLSGLEGLIRKGLPGTELARITELRDAVKASEPLVLAAAEAALPLWADSIGAIRHPITEATAQAAMEAYFLGSAPLTSAKNRDDIPDAFIYQVIKQIVTQGEPLIVVAEDDKLAKACEAIPQVVVHRTLASMIESESVQTKILDLDVVENIAGITDLLRQYELQEGQLSLHVALNGGSKLVGRIVHSKQIPDDNHDATITMFSDLEDIEFEFDNLSYFGSGKFGLPFDFRATVSVSYYIFKSDFFCLDEKKMPSVSEHNDHYYEAEDDRNVQVKALLRVEFSPDSIEKLTVDTIEENIKYSIDYIDDVEVIES